MPDAIQSTTDDGTPNQPIAAPTKLDLDFEITIGDTPGLNFSTGCVTCSKMSGNSICGFSCPIIVSNKVEPGAKWKVGEIVSHILVLPLEFRFLSTHGAFQWNARSHNVNLGKRARARPVYRALASPLLHLLCELRLFPSICVSHNAIDFSCLDPPSCPLLAGKELDA